MDKTERPICKNGQYRQIDTPVVEGILLAGRHRKREVITVQQTYLRRTGKYWNEGADVTVWLHICVQVVRPVSLTETTWIMGSERLVSRTDFRNLKVRLVGTFIFKKKKKDLETTKHVLVWLLSVSFTNWF